LGEDPCDQELVVVAALDGNRTAEDVNKQQDEHDGLKCGEHQQVRDPLDLDEVAFGHDETIAECAGQTHLATFEPEGPVSGPSTWAVERPVSERKTSSSVGRLRPTSSRTMCAASSRRKASVSTSAPPLTGMTSECRCASRTAFPTPSGSSSSPAAASWEASATVISRRSPPT